jgi:hypothetical protein
VDMLTLIGSLYCIGFIKPTGVVAGAWIQSLSGATK